MEGYRFKIVVLGSSDNLKGQFIEQISQRSWAIDGVSGHVYEHNQVGMDIWFPKENATSKVLVSFSYKDINGVVIVMGRRDRRILNKFKRKIQKEVGNIPFVGVVIRETMSEENKALKSLHSLKILCEKMREMSIASANQAPPEPHKPIPKSIPGKSVYNVDEFGFIILSSEETVPLFVDKPESPKKSKKK